MTDKKFAVVFDTNSYRNLVTGKTTDQVLKIIDEIKIDEAKKNIQAYGAVAVSLEMLSHLADEADFNYKDCLNGVIAMANHCFDDHHKAPRIIPHPYLHIARSFFDTIPTEIKTRVENIGGLVNDFKADFEKAIEHHKSKGTFVDINNWISKEEIDFSTSIVLPIDGAKEEILKLHPTISQQHLREKLLEFINTKFEPFHAMAIIYAVAITLQIQLTEDELRHKAFAMNLEFPLSVGFYRWISYKIVHDTIDMQSKKSKIKRWNWRWDYEVSFLISEHTLDNREVILVTADTDITDILNDFGYKNKVLNISQYLDYLKQP